MVDPKPMELATPRVRELVPRKQGYLPRNRLLRRPRPHREMALRQQPQSRGRSVSRSKYLGCYDLQTLGAEALIAHESSRPTDSTSLATPGRLRVLPRSL